MQTITPALEGILKAFFQAGASGFAARVEVDHVDTTADPPTIDTVSYRVDRLDIDKSLRLEADQAEVAIPRDAVAPLGWGLDSVFQKYSRFRIYQWYGDPANEVQTFTGLIDLSDDTRDPIRVTLTGRDLMALLIDYTFSTTAPQMTGETGTVRTEANGVFLNRELSYIVGRILDIAGWPAADRAITATSYVVDEFIWQDGASANEAITGDSQLTGLVGYVAWADELGVFHFAPSLATTSLTEPPTADYIFRPGEDLMSLADSVDTYDLRTRVKARGPLTTQVLTDEWRELWRTSKLAKPVGIWHDPAAAGNLRIVDRGTKHFYNMRQSDRVILSSIDISDICPHPLGLSGDPGNSLVYWLLNAPWIDGISGGNKAKKVRKSDNVVLSSIDLPDGQISSLKVSSSYLYFTRLDTDRFYRRSKTTGAAIASYQHTYGGTAQTNPSGMMIDGTTLHLFWANGGTTARFLECDESAPLTITKVVKTAGTNLHGGEMDTVTHTACYGDSDTLGLVAKFSLVAVSDRTDQVYAEVVDTELEDDLGALAQVQPRIHDTHPGDAAHPWFARRDTVDLEVITSLAQATETAMRRLDILSRPREVLDAGIIGNPALQKTDVFGVVDPVSGLNALYRIDAYRSTMDAGGTYVGTIAGITIPDLVAENGDIADGGDGTEDTGSAIKYTPLTMVTGDVGPNIIWEGDVQTDEDVVITIVETPAATGDHVHIRCTAPGCSDLDVEYEPKDHGWTETHTIRFSGSPVDGMTTSSNAGDPPASGLKHLTLYLLIGPDNPTTWTISGISVMQGGVEIPFITSGGGGGGGGGSGGAGYSIDPSGNDSTGDGSSGSPWATLQHALANAVGGDTIIANPGTYSGSGNHNLLLADITAPTGGVTIRAADPADKPIFDLGANGTSDDDNFFLISTGAYHDYTLDGLILANGNMNQDGIITVSDQTSGETTRGWRFLNMDIEQVGPINPSSQMIYLGERVDDVLVDNCIFRGPYPGTGVTGGAAVSAYSDTGPAPTNVVVQRSIFDGCFTGVQFYSSGVTGSILHNTFVGCRDNIDLTAHSTVLVRDNAGNTGTDASLYNPSPAGVTADHNYWGVAFDAGYAIIGPSPAIGGAHDGSDAGAL